MLNRTSNRLILRIAVGVSLLSLVPLAGVAQTTGTAARAAAGTSSQPQPYVPLTGAQRWHRYVAHITSPGAVVFSAASAGINQWSNTPGPWGQGSTAYGYRFASAFGMHLMRQTMQAGAAAMLDEDTRYFPSTSTSFGPRLKYALTSTVTARSRTGRRKFAFSTVGAMAGTAFLSRTWQPAPNSHPSDAMASFGRMLGVAAGVNVLHEFVPKISNLPLFHRD